MFEPNIFKGTQLGEDLLDMMKTSPETAVKFVNEMTNRICYALLNEVPLQFSQIVKRGLVDMLTLTDADGNDYGAVFPYQNLYLAEAKNSKQPKNYRISFNEKTEMYECWTETSDVNTEGETVWIRKMVTCLNIGQLLSCHFVGMGLDPCGEPKIAIYLEQTPCDFDHINIEMTTNRKENKDENSD